MKNFLKRLNWTGFTIVLFCAGAGAASRKQDATLYESFLVFLVLGVPLALLFLFIGIKPKE